MTTIESNDGEEPALKLWTPEEFCTFGMALHGSSHGWQSALARMLNVNRRYIAYLASGDRPVTENIQREMMALAGVTDSEGLAWPRDEWIEGDGLGHGPDGSTGRRYLIHARPPRFIARVVEIDELTEQPEPDEDPVDTTSGVAYRVNPSLLLCEIQWIDRAPADLVALMEAAADAIEGD